MLSFPAAKQGAIFVGHLAFPPFLSTTTSHGNHFQKPLDRPLKQHGDVAGEQRPFDITKTVIPLRRNVLKRRTPFVSNNLHPSC